jgi:hypothetical protein
MNHRLNVSAAAGAALALAMAAGSAQATFFSFASDVNSNAFTFAGTAGTAGAFSMSDFSRPNTFSLLVDDNNGPGVTISIPVEFHANMTITGGTSTLLGGGLYQHSYHVLGSFGFYDAMGTALLTVNIGPNSALLTVPGTQNAWSTTGAVLGADSFADVTYTATPAFVTALGGAAAAAQYGVSVGSSVGPDDFAFSLSVLNAGAVGATIAIDPTTKAPTTAWRSESSYSGSAFAGIPAPGACGLMAIGLGVIARRRNR